METKTYTIYIHINKINGKCYVGQTSQKVAKRWKGGNGYLDGSQPKFEKAIKKYGWENFEHKILFENLTLEEANKLEKELIIKYDSIKNGYNISNGGDGNPGHTVSAEAREKMRLAKLGKPGNNLGFRMSEETKQRLSQIHKGKIPYNKGKKSDIAICEKVRLGVLKAIAEHKIVKPVFCVELNKQYNSLTEASIDLNIKCCNISQCLKGKRKTAGGYHWLFVKNK